MSTPKRILFVDDEPMVLVGLQRSLRSMRQDWEMVFVESAAKALEAIELAPFDIVVTDMRMPGMDGAELLQEVKNRSPQALRMVLSGQSDNDSILRSVNPTHQYLSKPCDGEELKSRLLRAFALKDLLQNPELKELVSKLDSLPSLPALYLELTQELRAPEPSMAKVGKLITADMAMTAKVLKLVNSAFFGLRCEVSKASHAVEMLGLDTIRALVLSTHVFSEFHASFLTDVDMQYMWEHSLASSSYAKRLATLEHCERKTVDDCFTASLLHDAGKLILMSLGGDRYRQVTRVRDAESIPLYEAERKVFGCSHAEIGAYLFGLWGLPGAIVEAVAYHHRPMESLQTSFSPLAAVHVASVYHELNSVSWLRDGSGVSLDFLSRIGCADREKSWRSALAVETARDENPKESCHV
ncbi:MAG TPA: response regulator [Terriglobales bacterium]|nr:response regulator [Terriglobales bacterium]